MSVFSVWELHGLFFFTLAHTFDDQKNVSQIYLSVVASTSQFIDYCPEYCMPSDIGCCINVCCVSSSWADSL